MSRLERFFSGGLILLALVLPISIAGANIVFFTLAGVWVLSGPAGWARWPLPRNAALFCFLLFLGVSVISSLTGLDGFTSFWRLRKDLNFVFFLLPLAWVTETDQAKRVIKVLVWGTLLAALIGCLQWGSGIAMVENPYPFFTRLPAFFKHWPVGILHQLALLNERARGTRSHPIRYSESLLLGMGWVMAWIVFSKKKVPWLWVGVLAVFAGGLVASQTRGSWVAAGVMALILLGWADAAHPRRKRWMLILMPLALILCLPHFRSRLETITDRQFNSNTERLHMWQVGYGLWKQNPWLGIGPGNVRQATKPYCNPQEVKDGGWGHLHNTYIQLIVERGVLGLAAFLVFIIALIRPIWRGAGVSDDEQSWLMGTVLAWVAFMATGFTEYVYGNSDVLMTFYFIMALGLRIAEGQRAG